MIYILRCQTYTSWFVCVDTIFLARVNLVGKQAMENGPALDWGRRSILVLWARGSVTTDGAMEGAGEAGSASYVLGFVLFN